MAGKADMSDHLAGNLEGVTKKAAGEAIDAVFDYIQGALASGDRVQIPGFGTFTVSHRKERQGLNP
ncbi:MAG: HU family DNA-binding protein, partial [Thermoanaerobaculia bacterium]